MTNAEKRADWVRYMNWAQPLNGLLAVYESDGEQMLSEVLKDLKIASAIDLVKWAKNKGA